MTREIKFRAWDGDNKVMYEPDGISAQGKIMDFEGSDLMSMGGNDVLMQYTGLKDKNGKEIYEGDIVKYEIWEKFHQDMQEEIQAVEYSVEWAGWLPIVMDTKVDDEYYNYEIENVEIIGNIHENPELLTNQ